MSPSSNQTLVRQVAQQPKGASTFPVEANSLTGLTPTHYQSLDSALRKIFPEQQEETRLQKVRRIMGDAVSDLSDHELDVCISGFQQMLECWLDEFEKDVFNNLTLKQLLRET